VGVALAGRHLAAVPAVLRAGHIAWLLVGAWYLYRYLRGWLRFNDNQVPPT
jgi:uncharacterized membrane protein